jgi:cell division septal protein FtsQ
MKNPLLTPAKPKKAQPAAAKTAKTTAGVRAAPKETTPARAQRPYSARQQAQRRRLTRVKRRFEATFAALPKSLPALPTGWSLPHLAGSGWQASKLISLALVVGVSFLLVQVHTDERWFVYRENVQLHNLTYLDAEELYQAAGVEGWSIFWLRADTIRQRLLGLPYVAEATVNIRLPNQVEIAIQEQEPVALWVTEAEQRWLMPSGAALPIRDQRGSDLPQIIDPHGEAQTVQQTVLAMDPSILQSALTLLSKFPDLTQLRFTRDYGLNFNLPGASAWVYWGDGDKMETKFANLMAVQKLIAAGKENPQLIDVRFDRPYIR